MPSPGDPINPDDWTDQLDDHEDRISDLEADVPPLQSSVTDLQERLNYLLGIIRFGTSAGTVGGDGRIHCTFSGDPFPTAPYVVAGFGDYTTAALQMHVIGSSVDTEGFDVAVFYTADGTIATGEAVRVNYVAGLGSLIEPP